MTGLLFSSSQWTAPNGQERTHVRQPIQRSVWTRTPTWAFVIAPTGQEAAQGGSGQARHTMTTNPFSTPPTERTAMAERASPPSPNRREQAKAQRRQSTHRPASTTANRLGMAHHAFYLLGHGAAKRPAAGQFFGRWRSRELYAAHKLPPKFAHFFLQFC